MANISPEVKLVDRLFCSALQQRQLVHQVGYCGQLAGDSAAMGQSFLQEIAVLFGETSTDGELEPEQLADVVFEDMQPSEDISQVTNKSAPGLIVSFLRLLPDPLEKFC